MIKHCVSIRNTLGHEEKTNYSDEFNSYFPLAKSIIEKNKEQLNKKQLAPTIDDASMSCDSTVKEKSEEQSIPSSNRILTSYSGTIFHMPSSIANKQHQQSSENPIKNFEQVDFH